MIKRLAARLLYTGGTTCFPCGRWATAPCPGHEYGGLLWGYRRRRFAPWWIACHVDPRAGR